MNKILGSIIVVLISFMSVTAQPKNVERSAEIPVSEGWWQRLIQLKNGNTMFLRVQDKEGLKVMLFDRGRKTISDNVIEGKLWDSRKLGKAYVCGVHEINNEVVMFFFEKENDPSLYRLRINAETGALVKEDNIGHLEIPSLVWKQLLSNNSDFNLITVDKDPSSDCYAVTFANFNLSQSTLRIDHYNGEHKKINTAVLRPAGYKFSIHNSVLVRGEKAVYVLAAVSGGYTMSYNLCLASLAAGEKAFQSKVIFPSVKFKQAKSEMVFDEDNNKIKFTLLSYADSKVNRLTGKVTRFYETVLCSADPSALTVTESKSVNDENVDEYGKKNIEEDFTFKGMPQHVITNADKTQTVLMEATTLWTIGTILGTIGIVELDASGEPVNGYAFDKNQQVNFSLQNFFIADRYHGRYTHRPVREMSYSYMKTGAGSYVIFNDLPENQEAAKKKKKLERMKPDEIGATYCYKMTNGGAERFLLFDKNTEDGTTVCDIESSSYNDATETYAAIITTDAGKKNKSCVAWVSFNK